MINRIAISKYPSSSVGAISFIYIYALFALNRLKQLFSIEIKGIGTTNEVWIIPLICLLIYISNILKTAYVSNKYNRILVVCLFAYLFVILLGGFNIIDIKQYVYSVLIFVVPIFLFFSMSRCDHKYIQKFIQFIIVICLVYASFAIVLTTNYVYFMNLIGNEINYRYYSQYRASMMIGTSITVSYYFNITLPFCFYVFYTNEKKKWKIISVYAIIVNIIATLVLLSRLASICTFLTIILSIILLGNHKNYFKKIIFTLIIVITIIYTYQNYNLSRLEAGFTLTNNSDGERFSASKLGIFIFTQYPIFGSGMGRYFERVYEYKNIAIGGRSGLVDPHNLYILILSELGAAGFLITVFMFVILFISFSHIHDKIMRRNAYIVICNLLIASLGGSHLLNEISFSAILWIYLGLFQAVSIKDLNNMSYVNRRNFG